jgi:uncharacterized protein YtpQ (UPF0354 family)
MSAFNCKNALIGFEVPHVRKTKEYKSKCSFCNQEAEIKIFYSFPLSKQYRKILKENLRLQKTLYAIV